MTQRVDSTFASAPVLPCRATRCGPDGPKRDRVREALAVNQRGQQRVYAGAGPRGLGVRQGQGDPLAQFRGRTTATAAVLITMRCQRFASPPPLSDWISY